MPDLDGTAVWPGLAVACEGCARTVTPVMGEDGWILPLHHDSVMTWGNGKTLCPASLRGVDALPAAPAMETRIEEHVLAAMPEPPEDFA